jgi:uncharacterized phage protein (TIGR01671 family)
MHAITHNTIEQRIIKIRNERMREIKFRAWDKKRKEFVYLHITTGLVTTLTHDQETKRCDLDIPQQYIGINDKENKEIFEGDIVEFTTLFGTRQNRVVELPRDYGFVTCFTFKIIGNIYSNPELLPNQ